jgi:hypothetical protein
VVLGADKSLGGLAMAGAAIELPRFDMRLEASRPRFAAEAARKRETDATWRAASAGMVNQRVGCLRSRRGFARTSSTVAPTRAQQGVRLDFLSQ